MDTDSPARSSGLDDRVDEYMRLVRRGEAPSVEEFARRYPDHEANLLEVLPVVSALGDLAPEEADSQAVPDRLGDYRIVREIARGGMGVVYEAVEVSLGRRVALKVLPFHSLMDERRLERFQSEAKAAAALHHTNIVPVFGLSEAQGVHFYTMQFIEGAGLDRLRDALRASRRGDGSSDDDGVRALARALERDAFRPAGVANGSTSHSSGYDPSNGYGSARARVTAASRARLHRDRYFDAIVRLGVQVARALAYAHSHQIVHRDIKPSNVLVDHFGTAWITDFGLAKGDQSKDLTHSGELVGTLRYMPPERFDGDGGAASDVFSLGATLYEALTLEPAFDAPSRRALMEQIANEPPRRPRRIDPSIPRDLETILLKAMEKQPEARYRTADALAEDLQRFLSGLPPLAKKTTTLERLFRWCRRNALVAWLLAAIFGLLLTIAVGSSIAYVDTREALWRSYLNEATAARWSGRMGRRWKSLQAVRSAAEIRPSDELRREAISAMHLVDVKPVDRQELSLAGSFTVDTHLETFGQKDAEGRIHVYRDHSRVFSTPPIHPTFYQLSPDGSVLAATTRGAVLAWRVATGETFLDLAVKPKETCAFSRDGHRLGFCSGDDVVLIELASGDTSRFPAGVDQDLPPRPPSLLRWSFSGREVALLIRRGSGTIRVFDARDGQVRRTFEATGEVIDAAWNPELKYQMVVSTRGPLGISLWNALDGRRLRVFNAPNEVIDFVQMHPRGLLLGDAWDGHAYIWRVGQFDPVLRIQADRARLSRDGRRIALQNGPAIRIADVLESREHVYVGSADAKSLALRFHPRIPLLVTIWGRSYVLFADANLNRPRASCSSDGALRLHFSSSGDRLVGCGTRGIWVRDVSWRERAEGFDVMVGSPRKTYHTPVKRSVLRADARRVIAYHEKGIVEVDIESGTEHKLFDPVPNLDFLNLSPDDRWLVAGRWDGSRKPLFVWDLRSGELTPLALGPKSRGFFSPDARLMAAVSDEGCWLMECGSWKVIRRLTTGGFPAQAAFSPDGRMLALRDPRRTVRLLRIDGGLRSGRRWSVDKALELEVSPDEPPEITSFQSADGKKIGRLCFSPDGALLSGENRIWNLRNIREHLRQLGLDWDLPPYPAQDPRLRVDVTVEE